MFVANLENVERCKNETKNQHEMKIEYAQIRCAYSSTDENTIFYENWAHDVTSMHSIYHFLFGLRFDVQVAHNHIPFWPHTTTTSHEVHIVVWCVLCGSVSSKLDMLLIHMPFSRMKFDPLCFVSSRCAASDVHANDISRCRRRLCRSKNIKIFAYWWNYH